MEAQTKKYANGKKCKEKGSNRQNDKYKEREGKKTWEVEITTAQGQVED